MWLILSRHEIDSPVENSPRPEDFVEAFERRQRLLGTAINRHRPDRSPYSFCEVYELAIGRREGFRSSRTRNLSGGASRARYLPDLIASGAIGFEVDPLAVRSPGRHE